MDYSKIIEILTVDKRSDESFREVYYNGEPSSRLDRVIEAKTIAIDAVKKRIPQPVKYNNRHGDGADYWNMDYFNCPACGRRLRNKKPDPFCPRCGQALTWEVKA